MKVHGEPPRFSTRIGTMNRIQVGTALRRRPRSATDGRWTRSHFGIADADGGGAPSLPGLGSGRDSPNDSRMEPLNQFSGEAGQPHTRSPTAVRGSRGVVRRMGAGQIAFFHVKRAGGAA